MQGKKGKRGLSKKEIKELKQKEDEEFERLLSQAVAEVKSTTVSDGDSSTPEVHATYPVRISSSVFESSTTACCWESFEFLHFRCYHKRIPSL